MAKKDSVIAFIPVRGGSKSLPLKNIKPIAGKPLVCWALQAAINCKEIDEVYVATDSDIIKKIINSFIESDKLKVIGRSKESATDTASTEIALLEFAKKHKDVKEIILIQATSPLLDSKNLSEGYKKYKKNKFSSLLSVVRQKRFLWNENKFGAEAINYDINNRPRRQDWEGFLVENGAFYISSTENILQSKNRISGKIGTYEMPEETYFEIDEPADWLIAEEFLKRKYPHTYGKRKEAKEIKMLMMDVDGVLTDAGMYYTENGDEIKKFSTYDGKAIELLKERGIKIAILTSEDTKIVERRAKKLKIDHLYQNVKDKLEVARKICEKENICLNEVAYIGDDINDISLLKNVGMAACPNNAVNAVKSINGIIRLSVKGGSGAVRSFLKYIIGEVLPDEVAYTRNHLVTYRPWGNFETLVEKDNFKVKRIRVNPKAKLSLQMHHHRAEHWTVVQGRAKVTKGSEVFELKQDEATYIPLGIKHRIENEYDVPLEVIEVQTGGYLEEDDIIRFEDMYGRA